MKKLSVLIFAALLLAWAWASGGFSSSKDLFNNLNEKINSNTFTTRSNDSVLHQAAADAPADTLLYVINQPSDEELNDIVSYQLLKLDDNAPLTLLAPAKQGAKLQLYAIKEDGSRGGEIWSTDSSDKGLIVAAYLLYGEAGSPTYELYLEYDGQYASYYFAQPAEGAAEKFVFVTPDGDLLDIGGLD